MRAMWTSPSNGHRAGAHGGFAYYSTVADAQRELSELLGVPVDVVPIEQAKPRLAVAIEREAPPL